MNNQRLTEAYNKMMERVREVAGQEAQALREAIDHAEEKAVELGELTREEAERIGDYLVRDLHDAGEYLASSGEDLKGWLRFDMEKIEVQLLKLFTDVADKTSLELAQLAERARAAELPGKAAEEGYYRVQEACKGCHKKYRER